MYPIRTDFRVGVQYALLCQEGRLTREGFYRLWFPERRPEDLGRAMEAVGRFYNLGQTPGDGTGPIPYCLRRDAGAIFAAFRQNYGMDLATAELHWWHFRALLEGLFTHTFAQRVGYRTADLQGLSAQQRAEVLKLRAQYALEEQEDLESHLRRLDQAGKQEGK